MSGLRFAVMFRVSASFLRALDRPGKIKPVAPSSAPPGAICLLILPSTTTESQGRRACREGEGRKRGEALNNSTITIATTYQVLSVYGSVLSITHTLTDLMSSKMLFQEELWINPSRRKREMSISKSQRKHPLVCIKSDYHRKSSRAS